MSILWLLSTLNLCLGLNISLINRLKITVLYDSDCSIKHCNRKVTSVLSMSGVLHSLQQNISVLFLWIIFIPKNHNSICCLGWIWRIHEERITRVVKLRLLFCKAEKKPLYLHSIRKFAIYTRFNKCSCFCLIQGMSYCGIEKMNIWQNYLQLSVGSLTVAVHGDW